MLKATWYLLQQVVEVGLATRAREAGTACRRLRGRRCSAVLLFRQERVGRAGDDDFGGIVGHGARGDQVQRRRGEVVALERLLDLAEVLLDQTPSSERSPWPVVKYTFFSGRCSLTSAVSTSLLGRAGAVLLLVAHLVDDGAGLGDAGRDRVARARSGSTNS